MIGNNFARDPEFDSQRCAFSYLNGDLREFDLGRRQTDFSGGTFTLFSLMSTGRLLSMIRLPCNSSRGRYLRCGGLFAPAPPRWAEKPNGLASSPRSR